MCGEKLLVSPLLQDLAVYQPMRPICLMMSS